MTRISNRRPSRKLLPLAALGFGALMLTAAPVSFDRSAFNLHQAYAQGDGDGDHGSDRGGAEGSGADRGADRGSADKGSADVGGTRDSSPDSTSHDAADR